MDLDAREQALSDNLAAQLRAIGENQRLTRETFVEMRTEWTLLRTELAELRTESSELRETVAQLQAIILGGRS